MLEPDKLLLSQMLSGEQDDTDTIRDANARLTALLNAAVDALIIIDHQGTIELFNAAAESMFLCSKEDVVGKNVNILMPSPYKEKHDDYIDSYLKTKQTKIIGKGRKVIAIKSNGVEFPIFLSVGEVKQASHKQFIGIIRDISEQEKDKEEAKEVRERLSHVSRLSSMGEMAAGIAHEMNQPLTAISAYAQASKRQLMSPSKDSQNLVANTLDKITDQAIRASEVISRLRTFVKKRNTQYESVDLNKLIYDTINLAKVDTRILDHELQIELSQDKVPWLVADSVQIQQVLLNLIRNGIDAMEEIIGAPLLIKCKWVESDIVEVSVIDCGHGVNEGAKRELFNPFFTTKDNGMGMGLPVSQTIIHGHGGQLNYQPRKPNGSIFSFRLPAKVIHEKNK